MKQLFKEINGGNCGSSLNIKSTVYICCSLYSFAKDLTPNAINSCEFTNSKFQLITFGIVNFAMLIQEKNGNF